MWPHSCSKHLSPWAMSNTALGLVKENVIKHILTLLGPFMFWLETFWPNLFQFNFLQKKCPNLFHFRPAKCISWSYAIFYHWPLQQTLSAGKWKQSYHGHMNLAHSYKWSISNLIRLHWFSIFMNTVKWDSKVKLICLKICHVWKQLCIINIK